MVIRPLTNELQKKSEAELNEIPSRTKEDLENIWEWLKKQQHLNIRTEEQWILSFLRGCKFSLQKTKEKLDYFYTMRTLVPEFFADRDPLLPEVQEVLKAGVVLPLPKTSDPAGPRALLCRFDNCCPDKILMYHILKVYFMIMDIIMNEDDNCVVAGICIWGEYKSFSLNYLLQYTPSFLKKALLCLQYAYPIRVKSISCTNAPSAFETVYNLIKSIMSEKLRNRMNLFSEKHFEQMYESIPQSVLPKEYGGNSGSINELADYWKNKVESYREWFLDDAKYCSNEQLRLGKPKTTAEVFGVEGSFRKLSID